MRPKGPLGGMTTDAHGGLLLALVAGVLSGNCMLPIKFDKQSAWENIWCVFSIVSLLVLPWALALMLVPNLRSVYAALPGSAYVTPVLFGTGWGVAQVLFGLSIARLGLALGYAVIIGLGTLLGALVPLLASHREIIPSARGALILSGMAVMVVGVAVSAKAGLIREGGFPKDAATANYGLAIALAVLCGLMAPMVNYAFAFGQPIAEQAVGFGASPEAAGYAVWPIALLGGFVPNLLYCCTVLTRNGTWIRFCHGWHRDVWIGCLMGVLWMGAVAVYGVSTALLGALGTSVGWALFQIFMIMTANVSGVLTGEWKDAPDRARRALWVGLALLAAATGIIASGNWQA